MKSKVVGSMSEWSGMLMDFHRRIHDGSITLQDLKDFLEHKGSFGDNSLITTFTDICQSLNIQPNFTGLVIPTKPKRTKYPVRLLIINQGLTAQLAYDKCAELFPCWKYTDKSLDKVITKNERDAKDKAYAIWVYDLQEAEEDLKSLSANQVAAMNIPTMTAAERIFYELVYFKETGDHLDKTNITRCDGSRYDDGVVPRARWCYGLFQVDWLWAARAVSFLRARRVVSC